MTAAVEFESVSHRYGSVPALDTFDLRVEPGQRVALLGPNGAGKSTAIHLLLGLLEPRRGRVRILGGKPARMACGGRVTAMLQDSRLPARTSVVDVLHFLHDLYSEPMAVIDVLELTGLTDVAGRDAEKLSGGQAQRVRFAMALIGRPELFVLDEPTAALDLEARRAVWAALRSGAVDGCTVVFSTHNLQEAEHNAERIVVLADGRRVADGSPEEVKQVVPGRTVSVALEGEPVDGLASLPGVVGVDVRADRAYLTSIDADATVLALAATDRLRDLEVVGASLEEAFVALTGAGPDRLGRR
jgi:ABC-2 type transport system ATP-binding protein